ncbi:unnamed protein product [Pleuronectes platessa]|uniref:Uncharacterized protein n=1 Tax=Pleuronectes platessa TaxID=8262 RepID=A0A9N7TYY3_PLEPL|nr:unnamed protein product [Pleuronectes platessa]
MLKYRRKDEEIPEVLVLRICRSRDSEQCHSVLLLLRPTSHRGFDSPCTVTTAENNTKLDKTPTTDASSTKPTSRPPSSQLTFPPLLKLVPTKLSQENRSLINKPDLSPPPPPPPLPPPPPPPEVTSSQKLQLFITSYNSSSRATTLHHEPTRSVSPAPKPGNE